MTSGMVLGVIVVLLGGDFAVAFVAWVAHLRHAGTRSARTRARAIAGIIAGPPLIIEGGLLYLATRVSNYTMGTPWYVPTAWIYGFIAAGVILTLAAIILFRRAKRIDSDEEMEAFTTLPSTGRPPSW